MNGRRGSVKKEIENILVFGRATSYELRITSYELPGGLGLDAIILSPRSKILGYPSLAYIIVSPMSKGHGPPGLKDEGSVPFTRGPIGPPRGAGAETRQCESARA